MPQYDDDGFEQQEIKEQRKEVDKNKKRSRDLKSVKFVSHLTRREKEEAEQKILLGDREHPIWPEGETHILSGPSGVGKSSVLLPLIKDWSEGKSVMGFPTTPLPYVYIMCDGSETSLQRRLKRLGLSKWDIQGYSIEGIVEEFHFNSTRDITMDILPDIFKWARVFFIETINWFYKSRSPSQAKDYVDTIHFASEVRYIFGPYRTIIGTSHEAKMLEGRKYSNVRDRPHGTVAQAATAGTVMSMEKGEKLERMIHFAPREHPEFTAYYKMSKGGILEFQKLQYSEITPEGEVIEETEEEKEDVGAGRFLDRRLLTNLGNVITRETVLQAAEDLKISEITADRWLQTRIKDGRLQRSGRGLYIIIKVQ